MSLRNEIYLDTIEPLSASPTKWFLFKFRIEAAFAAKGWDDHFIRDSDPVDDDQPGDDATTKSGKMARRVKRMEEQKKSKATLIAKLDATSVSSIFHLKTTHEIWNALVQMNESATQASIASIRQTLSDLKWDGKDLPTFLSTTNAIFVNLVSTYIPS
jgi:hypothetical protein